MAKLKTLKINTLYDVEPTELHFHDRRNVLLGKNGSGKTTLLKLISMILRSDFSELKSTVFDIEFELTEGTASYRVAVHNERVANPPPAELTDSYRSFARIEYREAENSTPRVVVGDGPQTSLEVGGSPLQVGLSPIDPMYVPVACAHAFRKMPTVQPIAFRIDEGLAVFHTILGDQGGRLRVAHLPDGQLVAVPTFLILPKTSGPTPPDRLSFSSDQLSFLGTYASATGFSRVEMRIDLVGGPPPGDASPGARFYDYGKASLRCTRPDGRFFDHSELSFGQQRLWTFLYCLAANQHSIIADELVNGLHHDWIDLCLKEIGDRQAFLTSQNPLLFDCLTFESRDDVQKQFVLCSTDPSDPARRMRWTQMSDEKAADFAAAYKSGIQYVSEILRTEGLW